MKPLNNYHRKVVDWISALGVRYMEEYPVGLYHIDIYLPELVLGVEVDGPQHNRKKDEIRDATILKEWEIPIVRIKVGTRKAEALEVIFGPT